MTTRRISKTKKVTNGALNAGINVSVVIQSLAIAALVWLGTVIMDNSKATTDQSLEIVKLNGRMEGLNALILGNAILLEQKLKDYDRRLQRLER